MAKRVQVDIVAKDKGSKVVNKFSKNMSSKMKAAGAAMAAAFAVTKIAGFIKHVVDLGDKLNKMSIRTGVAVKSLDKLRKIGQLADVSLEAIGKAIKKMNKNMIEAGRGLEVYKRMFREIGINVENLRKQNPEEQFLQIAEAISRIEDPTRRSAAAQEVLGISGEKLLTMLPNLRREMANMNSEFTADKAKAAADFNDALTTLKEMFVTLTIDVLPPLNNALQNFMFYIRFIRDMSGPQKKLQALQKAFETLGKKIVDNWKAQQKLKKIIADPEGIWEKAGVLTGRYERELRDLEDTFKRDTKAAKEVKAAIDALRGAQDKATVAVEKTTVAYNKWGEAMKALASGKLIGGFEPGFVDPITGKRQEEECDLDIVKTCEERKSEIAEHPAQDHRDMYLRAWDQSYQ